MPILCISLGSKYIKKRNIKTDGEIRLAQESETNTEETTENTEILDLSRDIITAVKTPVYATQDDSKKNICIYHPNIKVHITQILDNGWASMEHQGATVYIRTSNLTNAPMEEIITVTTQPPEDEGPVYSEIMGGYIGEYTDDGYLIVSEEVTTEGNVFARSGPSESYDKVKLIKESKHLERVGIGKNGWSKVLINNKVLYIASFYLSPVKRPTYEDVKEIVMANRNANLRNSPSIRGDKKGSIKKGEQLTRVAIGSNG